MTIKTPSMRHQVLACLLVEPATTVAIAHILGVSEYTAKIATGGLRTARMVEALPIGIGSIKRYRITDVGRRLIERSGTAEEETEKASRLLAGLLGQTTDPQNEVASLGLAMVVCCE